MSRSVRSMLLMTIDVATGLVAAVLAFVIRFGLDSRPLPDSFIQVYILALIGILPVRLLLYYLLGLYRQVWSYASVPELLRIVWATAGDAIASWIIIFWILQPPSFPRSIVILTWFVNMATLCALRLVLRLRREWRAARGLSGAKLHRTMVYGAGEAGLMLVKEYARHPELGCQVVGFLDDDPRKLGGELSGIKVLGSGADLAPLAEKHRVSHLVIAMPSAKGNVIRQITEQGRQLGLQIKILPGIFEMVGSTVLVRQVRDVQIEDILGREEIKVDLEAIAGYLSGETVLVTGAGGSIGSELCRQAARFRPKQLLLLGHGENSIYEIHQELRQIYPDLDLRPVIADIQDEAKIRRIFEQYRPGVVFHAAAHKHVPLMEANPDEAIKNNIFGTLHVARAADFYKAKRFVLLSSDKAVNPTSVMGATKRAAEYVIQSLAANSATVFMAVRFGNVLGSRGSVIPLFKRQIAAGGPVTVTDPKMVRYFMTIPEAVQLVVQAGSMGRGGEVFVLDMGKPVRIVDLATDLIRLSGLEPEVDIRIEFTGVRPGEKLFEELLTAEEGTMTTMHERIYVARGHSFTHEELQGFLQSMQGMATAGQANNQRIRGLVEDLVSELGWRGAVGAGG